MSRINIVHVAINEHAPIFAELIELLSEQLERLGIEVSLTRNQPRNDCLNLLVGHTIFLYDRQFDALRGAGASYIVFQSEALHARDDLSRYSGYLHFLRGARQIWEYGVTNLPFLKQFGFENVHYVPIGYSRSLERIVQMDTKDIDVLFYGAMSERRASMLRQIGSSGVRLQFIFRAYGRARDEMIARSTIVLNLHQFENSPMEQLRLAYLLNNRCFIISETADPNPYGDGIVTGRYEQIPDLCRTYARPEMAARRDRIAETGLAALQHIPMLDHIRAALEQLPD